MTIRTLYLLRHAKSSWKDDSLADFDRPLKKRGREAADEVGRTLAAEKLKRPLLISSPAVRTRETTALVTAAGKLDAKLTYDARIYEASLSQLLEVIGSVADKEMTLILVGHNPGMEYLLEYLTGSKAAIPTAALAKILIGDSSWQGIERGRCQLEWLRTPGN
jgi:phosphohistidine phosphatase